MTEETNLDTKEAIIATHFYGQLNTLIHDSERSLKEKVHGLYQLFQLVFMEGTAQEKLQFTTFFSRVAFVMQKYDVTPQKRFFIFQFRKNALEQYTDWLDTYRLGLVAVSDAIEILCFTPIPEALKSHIPAKSQLKTKPVAVKKYKKALRLVLTEDDAATKQFIGADVETGEVYRVAYNILGENEAFNNSVTAIQNVFGFPVTVMLLRIQIDTEGVLCPRGFVIEPDYLVDVTTIADCFKPEGAEPFLYLLRRFLPQTTTSSMMKGHIANLFLDELVANPEATFQETFIKSFRINPLAFSLFEEREVREIYESSQGHFLHLKQVVAQEFADNNIDRQKCYLEPSFYAPLYGLQGRLDLLHIDADRQKSAIVELKSGSPFKANKHGIAINHFTQTLLYYLLVDATFKGRFDPMNYILYSVLDRNNLKYAPTIRTHQDDALNIRNLILALEWRLGQLSGRQDENDVVFKKLIQRLETRVSGFEKRDLDLFSKVYLGLSDIEKAYFHAFSGFIAREHRLAKIGVYNTEKVNGVAALWLNSEDEKQENYDIFAYLTIKDNKSHEKEPIIIFNKTDQTNPLANFRVGDIIVLYPAKKDINIDLDDWQISTNNSSILDNQIFKCSITHLDATTVTVRLRSHQLNQAIFTENNYWHIEHDMLDSSFTAMYRGLFEWARSPQDKRALLLAQTPPSPPESHIKGFVPAHKLTREQHSILEKMIVSNDYFLLWGPPGTGKTSMMLRYYVQYLMENTTENILLLAYTNRAVDEICESIEAIGGNIKQEYVRIGSRYSTAENFHAQLLDTKIAAVTSRKALKETIHQHRIFVATVASMSGKMELLQLKTFNRVVIDEASQILEPTLMGLLPFFDHFTLIGDHRQLPAVVTQTEAESAIEHPELAEIGLRNLRHSLFERLYKQAIAQEWTWAYDVLSQQGRMHLEIMYFPSTHFYQNRLKTLPQDMNGAQMQPLTYTMTAGDNILLNKITQQRILFLNTPIDVSSKSKKTNKFEAETLADIVKSFYDLYAHDNLVIDKSTIGIITPYRAQIAQIKEVFYQKNISTDNITIDTVERYQGGARDIILISLCTNDVSQLQSLISLSEEGIDRKFNVALTRAKKHLIVLGNSDILNESAIYKDFIDNYQF